MSYQLLTISGHDRPGIVRDVAEAMLHLQANIEDSSMTALRGRFTMMLIVNLPAATSLSALKAALAELEQRTALTVASMPLSDAEAAMLPSEPDAVITVSGGDRVGIVHAVTEVLAAHAVSIVDLSTRARHSEQGALYMMALEVESRGNLEAVRAPLSEVAAKLDVEIEIHPLDGEML